MGEPLAEAFQAVLDAAASLDPARIEVSITRSEGAGSPVTVGVVYHAPVSVPLVSWLFRSPIDVSGKAIMRQETQ